MPDPLGKACAISRGVVSDLGGMESNLMAWETSKANPGRVTIPGQAPHTPFGRWRTASEHSRRLFRRRGCPNWNMVLSIASGGTGWAPMRSLRRMKSGHA